MLNSYYNYKDIKYWNESFWKKRISQVSGLVEQLGEHEVVIPRLYPEPVDGLYGEACKALPIYHRKTNSVAIPKVIDFWRDLGVYYDCRSQGGVNWIAMAPIDCLHDFGKKLPTLVVMRQDDIEDPYWAMKTLDRYAVYNRMIADTRDLIIIYIISNVPDANRVYVNILQEAFVFVPGDIGRVYLDVSALKSEEVESLMELPITLFGGAAVPVIDMTGRWENRCSLSRDQVSKENWSSSGYDLERVVHSRTGARMAEGMALEYFFDTVSDPNFVQYWRDKGLRYESHVTKLRRWKSSIPLCAFDDPNQKLPVICVMQEVNHTNEHLAVTECSYFYEYYMLAAQGECALISFVLEDPDSNDLLCEILEEAFLAYPMLDRSRVYIAGHSHNGYYALEFTVRHPNLIAAVTTFGDTPGLQDFGLFKINGEKKTLMRSLDIPLINLTGCREPKCHYPLSSDGEGYRPQHKNSPLATFEERAASWQLRLDAFNCPMRSFEEIAATADSPEKAIRILGIPGDRSETVWRDGFELYMVDVANNEGKVHLRMVGEENLPHNTTPVQQELSWSFMRRFARDQQTGETIELY